MHPSLQNGQRHSRLDSQDRYQPNISTFTASQEGKVVGSGEMTARPDRYHEAYRIELSKNQSRFRLTKGEFTNYLERNHSNNECFGPLIGQERSEEKSL
jgi:hypothetical protein